MGTVCCFDRRVETTSAGSETGFKFRKVSKHWAALLAGSIPRAEELIMIYSSTMTDDTIDETAVMDALREPPQVLKKKLTEEYVRTRVAMSYAEFLANGHQSLPSSVFENIAAEVARMELGCQLILIPLRPQRSKHLYTVDVDGTVYPENDFCAIGTGASGATAWLHFRGQHRFDTISDTVCHLLEAKKFCETAPGVGKRTIMIVIGHNRTSKLLKHYSSVDTIWKKFGPRKSSGTKLDMADLFGPESKWDDIGVG